MSYQYIEGYGKTLPEAVNRLRWNIRGIYRLEELSVIDDYIVIRNDDGTVNEIHSKKIDDIPSDSETKIYIHYNKKRYPVETSRTGPRGYKYYIAKILI